MVANIKRNVGFEGFTDMTMKNAGYWDIKAKSYLTGDITSPLQSPIG
jgi:hypothetical protein